MMSSHSQSYECKYYYSVRIYEGSPTPSAPAASREVRGPVDVYNHHKTQDTWPSLVPYFISQVQVQ